MVNSRFFHPDNTRSRKGSLRALCICTNKTAGPQQGTAKVSHNNNTAVNDAFCSHHIHDGHSRSTAGFAIITVPHDPAVFTDNIRIAMMRGSFMLIPDVLKK